MGENMTTMESKLIEAASKGQVDELVKAKANNSISAAILQAIVQEATRCGHLHIVEWACYKGFTWCADDADVAAENGHLDILMWSFDRTNDPGCNTAYHAAKHGHLQILVWLQGLDSWRKLGIDEFRTAAFYGHINILKWGMRGRMGINTLYIAIAAAEGGQLPVFEWIIQNEWNRDWKEWSSVVYLQPRICSGAASKGHLPIIKLARQHQVSWNCATCSNAAKYGHFEVLRWAYENGCPMSAKVCEHCVEKKHDESFMWARVHDCPCNERTYELLAQREGQELLRWMIENGNGRQREAEPCSMIYNRWVIGTSGVELMKQVHAAGHRLTEDLVSKASHESTGDIDVLVWALKNNCPRRAHEPYASAEARAVIAEFDQAGRDYCSRLAVLRLENERILKDLQQKTQQRISTGCPVCLEDFDNAEHANFVSIPCGHSVCGSCKTAITDERCVKCRKKLEGFVRSFG